MLQPAAGVYVAPASEHGAPPEMSAPPHHTDRPMAEAAEKLEDYCTLLLPDALTEALGAGPAPDEGARTGGSWQDAGGGAPLPSRAVYFGAHCPAGACAAAGDAGDYGGGGLGCGLSGAAAVGAAGYSAPQGEVYASACAGGELPAGAQPPAGVKAEPADAAGALSPPLDAFASGTGALPPDLDGEAHAGGARLLQAGEASHAHAPLSAGYQGGYIAAGLGVAGGGCAPAGPTAAGGLLPLGAQGGAPGCGAARPPVLMGVVAVALGAMLPGAMLAGVPACGPPGPSTWPVGQGGQGQPPPDVSGLPGVPYGATRPIGGGGGPQGPTGGAGAGAGGAGKKHIEFDQAINYVTKIKLRFAKQPETYKQYHIIELHHNAQRINVAGRSARTSRSLGDGVRRGAALREPWSPLRSRRRAHAVMRRGWSRARTAPTARRSKVAPVCSNSDWGGGGAAAG
ncbi:hypothetical protein T492DRAFT_842665 [Pavlovales sp. CCMP2436]|nr:hypothetical protein T492DRAFT_842665 [Pavlovales sp. CCMP2436]